MTATEACLVVCLYQCVYVYSNGLLCKQHSQQWSADLYLVYHRCNFISLFIEHERSES